MPQETVVEMNKFVRDVATELMTKERVEAMLGSPEGRAFIVARVNEAVAEVKEKLGSEVAEERKLRTAAEEAAADMLMKMERRLSYDRDASFHRGVDGKLKCSVSRSSADSLATLIRAMRKGDIEATRAVSEGVNSEGGFTIQTDVANEILRLIPETGLYPAIARDFPMGTQKINIGDIVGKMTAYWPGENTAITPSYPTFGQVPLEAKVLGAFIPVPLPLIDDSAVDIGQLFADLVRECLALEIDRVGIVGSLGGGDPFNGLVNTTGIVAKVMNAGETSMKGFRADYLLDLQDATPEGARDGCSYLMSQSVFNYARKQKDADGNPIWQRPADGEPGTIFGKPYHLTERMPLYSAATQVSKRFVLYGNWKRWAIFGNRKELSVASSDVAGTAFQNNQLVIRGLTRVGFAAFGSAIAELETAAS